MLSAVILSVHSYPAMLLAEQLVHQRYVHPGLQPQDVMSRHRGAKHPRRYGLLGGISLLSPAYLLSVERWPFHSEPPDHYDRLSTLLDMYVSQSGRLMPLHSKADFRPAWAYHRAPPLLFGRRPPQSNYPPYRVPHPDNGWWLDIKKLKGGVSSFDSTIADAILSWCWRQRRNRYAIHAGQNLPDKEFRYLRTVIVTAAVHRGFILELALHHLTFRHRAGVSPYTSSYDLAETCVFDKQSLLPILCHQ